VTLTADPTLSPKSFPLVEIGDLVEFRRGLTYKKSDEVESSNTGVLRANNVDLVTGQLDLSDIRYLTDKVEVPQARKLATDSLLICTASGSRAHLGKMAHITNAPDLAFGGFMGLLVPKPEVSARYIWYFSRSEAYRDYLDSLAPGANINNLRFDDLAGLVLPLPPLDEQKRIVAKLDQAFAALDRARANAEANLASVTKLPEAWLHGLFEGSSKWPSHTLADVCENLDRLRVPITKGDREPGDIPYYGASGVVDHVKGHLFDEDLLLVSEDGANLLARTYPIAFSISGKAWINNHAHVLRFSDPTTQEFVRLYLNSISLKPYVTGMAQPKLNQAALNGIPVPMPAVDVRAEIVRKVHQISAEAERAADNYSAQSADIASLRQSLLQAAFSGQLS